MREKEETRYTTVLNALECCSHGVAQCPICPSDPSNNALTVGCMTGLAKDALELLKEQEARVMTKEEIIGWDGYIWFEFNGMKAMKTVLIDHGMVREPFRGDYPTKELSWGTCQETWRAWTAMPTDEQRKATLWEQPKEETQ